MRERLIDLLTNDLHRADNPLQFTSDEIVERLADMLLANGVIVPTADVVEVVRCKDCEYLLKDLSDRQAHLCMKNPFCRMNVKLDDFCSKGERKEDK